MPIAPTYPGVYIEEIPSGVRTITGVSTSVTAFLGFFKRGPMDKAVQVFSLGDFERIYGGLDARSEASYAIQQFFLNGGTQAWVVRVASGTGANAPRASAIALKDTAGGNSILLATAASEGAWGDNLRIDVDYSTTEPSTTFNLVVTELGLVGEKLLPVVVETFRNLIIDATKSNDALKVVNDGSKLITLALVGNPTSSQRPAQTGTVSSLFTPANITGLFSGGGALAAADVMAVSLNGTSLGNTQPLGTLPPSPTLPWLAARLQTLIRAVNTQMQNATVTLLGSTTTRAFLQVKSGTLGAGDDVSFPTGNLATKLGLDAGANVQQYALGATTGKLAQALPTGGVQAGNDGQPPDANALKGSNKTGLYALEKVDLFNILCVPDTVNLSDAQAAQVAAAAEAYCNQRRAFYILDVPTPSATARDEPSEISAWLDQNSTLRDKNAALYYPRPLIADSLDDFRLRAVAPSGTLAGLYARTDSDRGVWKAPAGTDSALRGVQKIEYVLTDNENGALNPLAINCLRNFPVYGNICWGARTLDGSDQKASEWKYIPVRRTALYLEESLYRGTKWVVFEPNDEPLWAQIRLNIGAFMHDLFVQGAFQGTTPREAYFVKCDKETTTQNDINRGVVNILVGFAPLKPAEFVIIKIQQIAGQIQT